MLNAYVVRPIGSKRFENYLEDLETRKYYENKLPAEIEIDIHGDIPWDRKSVENDPWANLCAAIVAMAIDEYLDYYLERNKALREKDDGMYVLYESKCIHMENFYFREDPYLSEIFDDLLYNVCWRGDQAIEDCQRRMHKVLRWTQSTHEKHRRK